jgi:SagB-type dehydrogenase family enzyme
MKIRRATPLACYWIDGRLIAHNYITGIRSALPPLAAEVLSYCTTWRTEREVCNALDVYPRTAVRDLIAILTKASLLTRQASASATDALDGWTEWMPAAAFFHFSTKEIRYTHRDDVLARLRRKARRRPPPPAVKRYPAVPRTLLPSPAHSGELVQTLVHRRTWRRFQPRARVALPDLATLLGLTWGVQRWMKTGIGTLALKTSPSGGARHPIEVYVLAKRVAGLPAGWYHYEPDAHALEAIDSAPSGGAAYVPHQKAFASAPVLFVMTAVFARTQWAYPHARAYRVVLLDAGHLAQTFCLLATALGLAPFSTAALDDRRLERDLGLDGIAESVIYACGVGARPTGVEWAPWPEDRPAPRVDPPASRRRSIAPRRKHPSR